MHGAQAEALRAEHCAGAVLAAQVLGVGLRDARSHLRHQRGNNAPATG